MTNPHNYLKHIRKNSLYPTYRFVLKAGYIIDHIITIIFTIALFWYIKDRYVPQLERFIAFVGGCIIIAIRMIFTQLWYEIFSMVVDLFDSVLHKNSK